MEQKKSTFSRREFLRLCLLGSGSALMGCSFFRNKLDGAVFSSPSLENGENRHCLLYTSPSPRDS